MILLLSLLGCNINVSQSPKLKYRVIPFGQQIFIDYNLAIEIDKNNN